MYIASIMQKNRVFSKKKQHSDLNSKLTQPFYDKLNSLACTNIVVIFLPSALPYHNSYK